jgi:hypothetical protein
MAHTVAHPVGCRTCGNDMLYVGKLPAIGLHAAVQVFKCHPCKMVHSRTAEIARAEEVVALWPAAPQLAACSPGTDIVG